MNQKPLWSFGEFLYLNLMAMKQVVPNPTKDDFVVMANQSLITYGNIVTIRKQNEHNPDSRGASPLLRPEQIRQRYDVYS